MNLCGAKLMQSLQAWAAVPSSQLSERPDFEPFAQPLPPHGLQAEESFEIFPTPALLPFSSGSPLWEITHFLLFSRKSTEAERLGSYEPLLQMDLVSITHGCRPV